MGVPADNPPTVEAELDAELTGAIEIARHWLRNPGEMRNAGFEQVCRELYTVSRGLIRLASKVEAR